MKITNESKVDYIDHMGSDLTVVNAARVSFDKTSDWEENILADSNLKSIVGDNISMAFDNSPQKTLKPADVKLINYLARHKHWSPFSHVTIQLRITTPIFVARQLDKHQIGLTKNEISRRYVSYEPEFYMPPVWRKKPDDKKQGSGNDFADDVSNYLEHSVIACLEPVLLTYTKMIESGVAPEQARMILPQNMMTSYYLTGSLYAFARLYTLRVTNDAQYETQSVAKKISSIAERLFPVSWREITS